MLEINAGIVCDIIQKIRVFQAKESVTFPVEGPPEFSEDNDWLQTLASHRDDLSYLDAKKTIENLEPDQQIMLVALMYLGREDYSIDEWETALETARNNWTTHTANYLLSRPLAADYLEGGLAQLGRSCEEMR